MTKYIDKTTTVMSL